MSIMWLVMPLSILIHILTGQITALTTMFLNPAEGFVTMLVIIFMTFMGFKDLGKIKPVLKKK